MALSCVKQLENLHLIAFQEKGIKVTTKSLYEINHLRQTYHPDLPQYIFPKPHKTLTRKRILSGALNTDTSNKKC